MTKKKTKKVKEKRKMNKPLISLIGLFLLLLGLCLSAGAEDVIWHPRTPAGGGGIGTDFYFQMAEAAKKGSGQRQVTETFDGSVIQRGFYELTEDGQVVYYDMSGNKVNLDGIASIEDDPNNPPNGVVYYSAPRQVITY